MTAEKETFQDKLKKLQGEYAELLPLRLSEIDRTWRQLQQKPEETELAKQLRACVHTLAGSGATFGYPELSAVASQCEEVIDRVLAARASVEEITSDFTRGLRRLYAASRVEEHRNGSSPAQLLEEVPVAPAPKSGRALIWLGADEVYARNMGDQLQRFNYQVIHANDLDSLELALDQARVEVLILDLGTEEQPFAEKDAFLARMPEIEATVICLSPGEQNMPIWLEMIRAGAEACLPRPMSLYPLLDKLQEYTEDRGEPPYRLFIIDDDEMLAKNMATVLTKAGMQVTVENDPMRLPDVLPGLAPDLILIDLYMPVCNGLELARMIRQNHSYDTVPIVYLSAETEVNKRLEALEAGADDFILKPVKLRYLYHSLSSRIKRARQLRQVYERDYLTGLLNHTAFQQELRRMLWGAIDTSQELVAAVIDVDRIRTINEHHGHDTGDRLLKTLAIMLRRNFSGRGILSRFGGSHFALALVGQPLQQVAEEMERVRNYFSRVDHEAGHQLFEASFCAGLAHYPSFGNAAGLLEACERAVARAKLEGRNQVMIEEPRPASQPKTYEGEQSLIEELADDDLMFVEMDSVDETPATPVVPEQEQVSFASIEALTEEPPALPDVTTTEARARGSKIVVVDDDKQLLDVITSFLGNQGYKVTGVSTGDEAYQVAKSQNPDLMLIDLLLFPGIHGFELCKKIKQDREMKKTKIILMTAVYKDYRYQVEGREAGGDAFVIKPINFDELQQKINALLA